MKWQPEYYETLIFWLLIVLSLSKVQNSTTLELMKRSVERWSKELSTPEKQIQPYFINIGLQSISESKLKSLFNKIPTSFALSRETVDKLVTGGHNLLHKDPEYQRLVSDMGGKISTEE